MPRCSIFQYHEWHSRRISIIYDTQGHRAPWLLNRAKSTQKTEESRSDSWYKADQVISNSEVVDNLQYTGQETTDDQHVSTYLLHSHSRISQEDIPYRETAKLGMDILVEEL